MVSLYGSLDTEIEHAAWPFRVQVRALLIPPLQASSAGKQRIAGLESVCTSLRALIVQHLFEKGAWHPSQCHVLGFSQGGTVALELTRFLEPGLGLGSCVAVSAGLLPEWLHAHSKSTEVPRVGQMFCRQARPGRLAAAWGGISLSIASMLACLGFLVLAMCCSDFSTSSGHPLSDVNPPRPCTGAIRAGGRRVEGDAYLRSL